MLNEQLIDSYPNWEEPIFSIRENNYRVDYKNKQTDRKLGVELPIKSFETTDEAKIAALHKSMNICLSDMIGQVDNA